MSTENSKEAVKLNIIPENDEEDQEDVEDQEDILIHLNPPTSNMDGTFVSNTPEDDLQLRELMEKLTDLEERERRAKEKSVTTTEFQNIQRDIRRKRFEVIRRGRELSFNKDYINFKSKN